MSTYQLVVVCGRLGRDPELRYLQTGTPVTNLSLATDESYKDKDGNKVQQTEWHRVNVFGKQAEHVSNYLGKGSLALVEGRLNTRKWQDQQGNNRYSTEIKAQRVVFMGSRSSQNQQSDPQSNSQGASEPQDEDPFAADNSAPF